MVLLVTHVRRYPVVLLVTRQKVSCGIPGLICAKVFRGIDYHTHLKVSHGIAGHTCQKVSRDIVGCTCLNVSCVIVSHMSEGFSWYCW